MSVNKAAADRLQQVFKLATVSPRFRLPEHNARICHLLQESLSDLTCLNQRSRILSPCYLAEAQSFLLKKGICIVNAFEELQQFYFLLLGRAKVNCKGESYGYCVQRRHRASENRQLPARWVCGDELLPGATLVSDLLEGVMVRTSFGILAKEDCKMLRIQGEGIRRARQQFELEQRKQVEVLIGSRLSCYIRPREIAHVSKLSRLRQLQWGEVLLRGYCKVTSIYVVIFGEFVAYTLGASRAETLLGPSQIIGFEEFLQGRASQRVIKCSSQFAEVVAISAFAVRKYFLKIRKPEAEERTESETIWKQYLSEKGALRSTIQPQPVRPLKRQRCVLLSTTKESPLIQITRKKLPAKKDRSHRKQRKLFELSHFEWPDQQAIHREYISHSLNLGCRKLVSWFAGGQRPPSSSALVFGQLKCLSQFQGNVRQQLQVEKQVEQRLPKEGSLPEGK